MEVNKDEAERCKTIAANALQQGSYDKAVKFLKKSLSLYPLPGVEALLATAERARDTNNNSSGTSFDSTRSGNNNNGSGYTNANTSPNTNTSSSNNANARASSGGSYSSRTTSTGSESNNSSTSIPSPSGPSTRSTSNVSESGGGHGRSYTQAQVDIVEKILKAKDSGRGAHYRVLEVNVNCTEADLKKSYRKIALKVHPGTSSKLFVTMIIVCFFCSLMFVGRCCCLCCCPRNHVGLWTGLDEPALDFVIQFVTVRHLILFRRPSFLPQSTCQIRTLLPGQMMPSRLSALPLQHCPTHKNVLYMIDTVTRTLITVVAVVVVVGG